MRHLVRAIAVSICALVACASISHTEFLRQPMDKALIAGPGDLVLRIDRERSLENAFGKADVFGRKTKEGFTELHFAGVEPNGEIVLFRKDVQIVTNETTMSRTPITTTTGTASTSMSGSATRLGNTTQVRGTSTTNYTSTTLAPLSDFHVVVPSDAIAVRVGSDEKRIPVGGFVVEIISASRNALEYRITKPE